MSDPHELYHLGVPIVDVPAAAILAEPGTLSDSSFDDQTPSFRRREYTSRFISDRDARLLVCSGATGAPPTVIALEELARAGSSTMMVVNRCRCDACESGTPDHGAVLVTSAVRGEGTSKDYAPMAFPAVPDASLTLSLHAKLPAFALSQTRTVDVLDAWTPGRERTHAGPVDLSAAAVCVVAAVRRVAVAVALIPAGEPGAATHDLLAAFLDEVSAK